jgi:hypothetical protein
MRFTDSIGIPAPIKRAIEWQAHSHNPKSDVSCTTLIGPPLLRWLRKRYEPYVTQDYRKMLWVLHGSLIHLLLEKFGEGDKEHAERTVKATINGWVVSATLDYVQEGDCLTDYKYTSVWASKDGVKEEWEAQLNVGLYLLRHDPTTAEIGESIKKLAICIWYRDWRTSEKADFPNEIEVLDVPVWTEAVAEAYIEERVKLHQQFDEALPPMCADKERWLTNFAVMKNGRKTAVRAGFRTREEAEAALGEFKCDYIREAAPKRCVAYCAYGANGFCPYWNPETQQTRAEPLIAPTPKEYDDKSAKRDAETRKGGPNV